jgi:hypothetical protein
MDAVTYMYLFAALALILQIATAVVLIRKYLRTRAISFIVLSVSAMIWPLLARWTHVTMHRVALHQFPGVYPVSLVYNGQMTLGAFTLLLFYFGYFIVAGALLASAAYLCKAKIETSSNLASP